MHSKSKNTLPVLFGLHISRVKSCKIWAFCYFLSGIYQVKFGNYVNSSGKYHAKFWHFINFVNFLCMYFRAKMSCPPPPDVDWAPTLMSLGSTFPNFRLHVFLFEYTFWLNSSLKICPESYVNTNRPSSSVSFHVAVHIYGNVLVYTTLLMGDEHSVHSAVSFTDLGQEVVTVRWSDTCLTFRHSVVCMKQNTQLYLHHQR